MKAIRKIFSLLLAGVFVLFGSSVFMQSDGPSALGPAAAAPVEAGVNPVGMTEEITALIGKITMIADPAMEDRSRGIRGARIRLTLKDGSVLEESVSVPKGDPENPLTRQDILAKLKTCAGDQVSEAELSALAGAVLGIGGEAPFENPMLLLPQKP